MIVRATTPTWMRKAAAVAGLCFGLSLFAAAASAAPTLTSGKIESGVIRIGAVPVAPKVTLDLHGNTERVFLTYTGPNGQLFQNYFYSSERNGKSIFDGAAIAETFSQYTPAGTWTLSTVKVCSDGPCNTYTGSTLTPLFPSLTFMVVNPHSDTTLPTINSAVIQTPTVKTSNNVKIEVDVNIQDNLSGVVTAEVTFNGGSDYNFLVGNQLTYPVKSAASYKLTEYCRCQNVPTGTYSATRVILRDAAGNVATITNASQISTLFGGQKSFTVGD